MGAWPLVGKYTLVKTITFLMKREKRKEGRTYLESHVNSICYCPLRAQSGHTCSSPVVTISIPTTTENSSASYNLTIFWPELLIGFVETIPQDSAVFLEVSPNVWPILLCLGNGDEDRAVNIKVCELKISLWPRSKACLHFSLFWLYLQITTDAKNISPNTPMAM